MPIDRSLQFIPVRIAILKVDNDPHRNDEAGDLLAKYLLAAGHDLADRARELDDLDAIIRRLERWVADPEVDCVISTGGTGLTARDVTPDALTAVADRDIPGFGELFRNLSIASVGSSAMQSRACGAIAGGTCLFAVPGSPRGAADAWTGILSTQLDSRHRPCNLVALMPGAERRSQAGAAVSRQQPARTQI
jgi:molybdenum cofactor biosynthesis protein B